MPRNSWYTLRVFYNNGSQPPKCNIGVNHAFQEITGSDELAGMRANEMYDRMSNSPNFTPVHVSEVQGLANRGEIVVAAWKNPSGSSGHVALAVPGEAVSSGTWEGEGARSIGGLPLVMDTGSNKRTESSSVNYSFGKSKQPEVVFFLYSDPNFQMYNVYDERTNRVVVTYMSSNVIERDYTPFGSGTNAIWYRTYQRPPELPKVKMIEINSRGLQPIPIDL